MTNLEDGKELIVIYRGIPNMIHYVYSPMNWENHWKGLGIR